MFVVSTVKIGNIKAMDCFSTTYIPENLLRSSFRTENKVLGEAAIKRLNVLKEFTELGSGYHIANRDLSIRGAGDILGSEQAGFMDTIGIDLYLKILNDEIKRLKGETIVEEEIKDEKPILNVTTHISDKYTN